MAKRRNRSILTLCITENYNHIVSPHRPPASKKRPPNGHYPQSRVLSLACVPPSGAVGAGKSPDLRRFGQSPRPRAQLRAGSEPRRRPRPGDGYGAGSQGTERDPDPPGGGYLRSPLPELRSAALRPRGAHHREYRARYLAAARTAFDRRPPALALRAGLRDSGLVRGLSWRTAVFRVTRSYRFAASHRLNAPQLSELENRTLYGKCNNPYGHGHNYVVEVSARGPLDDSGRAVDTSRLDDLVQQQVLPPFSHRNLNLDGNWFERVVPTSENLAVE